MKGGNDRLICALDVESAAKARALVARLGGAAGWLKVGLELFTAEGPTVLSGLPEGRVFLDLKLHDIPETVGRAVARVARYAEVGMLTVHACGGRAMLARAVKEAGAVKILAVTVLTSLDATDLREVGDGGDVEDLVVRRARLAAEAGCHGVVCSPREAAIVRADVPAGFLVVTPGVRPAGVPVGDQKRVATAAEAIRAGASHVVVGRPIRDAADPFAQANAIAAEIAGALA